MSRSLGGDCWSHEVCVKERKAGAIMEQIEPRLPVRIEPVLHYLLKLFCFLFPGSKVLPESQMPLEQIIGGEDIIRGKCDPETSH